MKNGFRLSLAALAAGAFLASGCGGFTVKPPKPEAMPQADAPVPLKVGVRMNKPRFDWQGAWITPAEMERSRERGYSKDLWAQVDGIAGKFLSALQDSSGFAQVDEVGAVDEDQDLIIDADFSGKYTEDPAHIGKIILVSGTLGLLGPFVHYNDSYFAAAELSVSDNAGRLLHKYSERQDAATSAKDQSASSDRVRSAGIESAGAHLAAKLVTAILADRADYQRALKQAPRTVSHKPVPAPAEVSAAPLPSPAPIERVMANSEAAHAELAVEEAKTEPTPPAQAANDSKPARRGPITPAEETQIDEQVMP